jgi:hypothetical protein
MINNLKNLSIYCTRKNLPHHKECIQQRNKAQSQISDNKFYDDYTYGYSNEYEEDNIEYNKERNIRLFGYTVKCIGVKGLVKYLSKSEVITDLILPESPVTKTKKRSKKNKKRTNTKKTLDTIEEEVEEDNQSQTSEI